MEYFKKISELDLANGFPPPEHPLISLNELSASNNALKNKEITCDFYIIALKKLKSGVILYGRTKYDHDRGSMFFMKPGQHIICQDMELYEKGFGIHVHEDFLMGHPLFTDIKKYGYFDYETSEALHLSPREEKIMWSLFHKMETEYHNNQD